MEIGIENGPDDARLVRELLSYARGGPFDLECVDRLSTGLERLRSEEFDVVLLDLGLQTAPGQEGLAKLCTQSPHMPVVVLTGSEDDSAGLDAVRAGAQDYVIKGWTDGNVLSRAIR